MAPALNSTINKPTLLKLWTILFLLEYQCFISLVSALSSISPSDIGHNHPFVSSYSSNAADAILATIVSDKEGSHRSRKSISLDHLPTQSRHRQGFSIAPRGCEIDGTRGTCMFVWECLKTDGKHLGMCMDGFMFGSCCIHDESKNMVDEINEQKTTSSMAITTKSTTTTSIPLVKKTPFEMKGVSMRKRPTRPSKPTKPNRYYPIKSLARSTTTTTKSSTTTSMPTTSITTSVPEPTTPKRIVVFEPNSQRTRPTRPPRPPKPPASSFMGYYPSSSSPHHLEEKQNTRQHTTPRSFDPASSSTPAITTTMTTSISSTTTTTTTTTVTSTTGIDLRLKGPSQRSVCGVPQTKFCPTARIVNGSTSCFGQFPWLVSVRRTTFFGFSTAHRCGGALINENWVATAGHCVDDLLVAKIRVRIGELDFESSTEPEGHEELKVIQKLVHPKYNYFTFENDLALIKLERSVRFRDNIIPICLPGNDDLLIGETGIVAGWGRMSNGGQLPNVLQYVSVPIVSNNKCESMFLKAGRNEAIPDIFLCAGYDDGGRDSCQGDSGGPLVVKGQDGRYFLGGIISWGIGCAQPNLPGVCTRISRFRDWIVERVQ
eukprot:TRINITY_DN5687_c0_g1_i1.p1 TRINITY_DN5687_c0_g1~~TRINITY_DN5687_c0_g1_i1.p1  ORF type:complete len:602 (-),score=82.89 TRINITY_DN5687_c0_g1_i1:318-2123(-)